MKKDRLAMAGICLFVLAGMIYIALNDTETDNSKNQGKNEAYESGENAAADEVTDTVRGAEEDAFSKEETTEPHASANQEEEPEVSQTPAEEILFEDPEDIGEYQWVYDYADFSEAWDGDDEWNLPYVDDETFEMLRAAYEEVDFSGEFELGDPELYDEYREKYWRMLQNNGPVMDKETGSMMSITDLNGHFDYDNWQEFHYFFYDVDGDGAPELGIYSFARFIYLFDYDEETDRFRVWFEMGNCYYRQVGTRKVMFSNLRNDEEFYLLDENGDFECVTIFNYDFRSGRNDETRFLRIVMLPFHADKKVEPTQGMKENGIYVRYRGDWYFRLTDEQKEKFADVYQAYYDAYESEKDGEVCYKYEELFGDFIQEASQE